MTDALLTHNFVDRLHDIPWHVVPVLLNRFCGEPLEIYEEEEKDYE